MNTLFNALLHTPGFDRLDFIRLRVSLGGGMAVQKAVADSWKQVTGNTLTQAWGLTETSPGATLNRLDAREFTGSIGLPIPSTIITIRDDDGNVLPLGQSGEICVAGPQVMLDGGVLRTGDIGYMDPQGYVFIEVRRKDMVLVSGFNVYPDEVEGVALFVVKKDPSLTEEGGIEHCRKSLTGYKVPKRVYFLDELPKSNVGKILRRELRDQLRK